MPNLTAHPSRKTRLRAASRITTYRRANKSPRGSSGNQSDHRDSARVRARSVSDCTLAINFLLTLGVARGGTAGVSTVRKLLCQPSLRGRMLAAATPNSVEDRHFEDGGRRQVESRMSVRLGRMFRHQSVLHLNKFSSAESSFFSSNRLARHLFLCRDPCFLPRSIRSNPSGTYRFR